MFKWNGFKYKFFFLKKKEKKAKLDTKLLKVRHMLVFESKPKFQTCVASQPLIVHYRHFYRTYDSIHNEDTRYEKYSIHHTPPTTTTYKCQFVVANATSTL